ncbi:MAG: nitronate monooxygenase, partial [Verrucomicrobia bacterium]|nr:nitronate monooxygenase [Verrucomicrobiota bacterium]
SPFATIPMPSLQPPRALTELTVAANFAEVYLAKEGHTGKVGINLLEKIQFPTLPSLYGAMLAGVDYVLMGAGIPRAIPGAIDRLSAGQTAEIRIDVDGALPGEEFVSRLDPAVVWSGRAPALQRPYFFAIVSSATLAQTLARKSNGRVDGFVVEGDVAGGHNAPPRGPLQLSPAGEPLYGPRDAPDLQKFRELGLPFWLAGAHGRPAKLADALAQGAAGVQVGTVFAFCQESGIDPHLKRQVLATSQTGPCRVFTSPVASPTGFPFKVLQLPETVSDRVSYAARQRICDLGYLRQGYRRDDGTVGYRCASEPVEDYVRKGGTSADTVDRVCLCNGLVATAGLPQTRATGHELPLLTAGNDFSDVFQLVAANTAAYCAADVVAYLRGTGKSSHPAASELTPSPESSGPHS